MNNSKSGFSFSGALSRRRFVQTTALAALAFPYVGNVLGANERINIACIGVGGKGDSDTNSAYGHGGNIVALCDVDANRLKGKHKYLQDRAAKDNRTFDAKLYSDYRKLFDEVGKSIDAVTVSTPDHHHAVASVMAMRMGKHVYCQKPLCQNVTEARADGEAGQGKEAWPPRWATRAAPTTPCAAPSKSSRPASSATPKELHVWSNRPVWPQGLNRPGRLRRPVA